MRVEDPSVFEDTHALILSCAAVRSGTAGGPCRRAGRFLRTIWTGWRRRWPDTPIWIEKILTGDEPLPDAWATEGTTGYEAGA